MVVASHVDGRVRIRDDGLKKGGTASRIKEALLAEPGVSGVESNPRVGSLLVLYSAALTALEKILKKISEMLGSSLEAPGSEERPRSFPKIPLSISIPAAIKRKALNVGMLLSLILSVGAAVVCLKKLHIALGIIFTALAAQHTYQRRRLILA